MEETHTIKSKTRHSRVIWEMGSWYETVRGDCEIFVMENKVEIFVQFVAQSPWKMPNCERWKELVLDMHLLGLLMIRDRPGWYVLSQTNTQTEAHEDAFGRTLNQCFLGILRSCALHTLMAISYSFIIRFIPGCSELRTDVIPYHSYIVIGTGISSTWFSTSEVIFPASWVNNIAQLRSFFLCQWRKISGRGQLWCFKEYNNFINM